MNYGFALMCSCLADLLSLGILGTFFDKITDCKWMDMFPAVGTLFSFAIVLLVLGAAAGFAHGVTAFVWSLV